MENIRRIIISVDNDLESKNAVRQGAYLAKLLDVEAKIISVNDTHQFISSIILEDKLKKEAENLLDNYKKIGEEFGINIQTEILSGKPDEEIVRYVTEEDLLIITDEGKKIMDKFISTSISERIIHKSPCPVLIVKA